MFNFAFKVNGIKDKESLLKAMEVLQETNLDGVEYSTISTSIEDTGKGEA